MSLADTLKGASPNASVGGGVGVAKILIAAQVSTSLLLLIGSGLFLRTLYNLKSQNVGYNPEHLVLMRMDPISAGYRGDDIGRVCKNVLDRIASLPGVRAATFSENGLFSGTESGGGIDVEGFTPSSDEDHNARFDQVGPLYFTKVGIPLLLGRDITERDNATAPRVAVINETMAKFYFPGGNPVGRHIRNGSFQLEIVGVVRDAQDHDLRQPPVRRFYVSYFQPIDGITIANFEIRSGGNAAALIPTLRNEVQLVDRRLPILSIREATELIEDSIVQERLIAKLSTCFGVVAVGLAALGLYGVMSYTVARRTSEIGIRMALGAQGSNVIAMILRDVLLLIAAGTLVGVGAAAVSSRLVISFLFGLKPNDTVTFVAGCRLLLVVGVLTG